MLKMLLIMNCCAKSSLFNNLLSYLLSISMYCLSNFLLTQIEELLPTGFAGDPNAAAKYGVIQSNFKSRLTELEDEVKLAKKGSKTQLDLIKQRANVQHIIRRLDTVMNAFTGKTPTKAESLYNITGIQPGMELPTDEESLDALALEWKKTTGLEDDLN